MTRTWVPQGTSQSTPVAKSTVQKWSINQKTKASGLPSSNRQHRSTIERKNLPRDYGRPEFGGFITDGPQIRAVVTCPGGMVGLHGFTLVTILYIPLASQFKFSEHPKIKKVSLNPFLKCKDPVPCAESPPDPRDRSSRSCGILAISTSKPTRDRLGCGLGNSS